METAPQIFDRRLLMHRRDRAAEQPADIEFLFRTASDRLTERLRDLRRNFDMVLNLGCRTGYLSECWPDPPGVGTLIHADLSPAMAFRAATRGPAIACDEEHLPIAEARLDAVLSCLALHWVNDLPGTLVQIRRALRPDGLLLASLAGHRTLFELRDALTTAEIELTGGASPHVSPFADVRDLGSLLQRAGFALPVVDADTLTVTYPEPLRLLADLRRMGEANALSRRHNRPLSRRVLFRAAELYQQRHGGRDGRVPATFEILTMTGWAPDPAQQRPLRPGSARARIADALATVEFPVPEDDAAGLS